MDKTEMHSLTVCLSSVQLHMATSERLLHDMRTNTNDDTHRQIDRQIDGSRLGHLFGNQTRRP
jgi:hypothetical protein